MMKPLYVWLVIAVAPMALDAQSPRSPVSTADVPVTKVLLFSSGVGYFEHGGTVRGNSATELRFNTNQINDILKSIVLQDQDGGHVGAITYPSQDPLAKTLKSFQVDITRNPSLADLLNQLRGARVTLASQAERVNGTILGVESRKKPTERGEVDVPVLNLLSGAMIRSIELQSIASLSLDDPQLQDELTKALAALVQARDQDKKPVTINFTGSGERRVRIGYVVETPVWKTSYRLLLGDKSTPSRLQGWAIVENQTESDWNGVSLSLVSGRPLSFMMDLYQPLYATRPTVVPELFASLKPQVYDAATAAEKDKVMLRSLVGAAPGGRGGAVNQLQSVVVTAAAEQARRESVGFAVGSTVEPIASAAKMGELFQYAVPNVTLARQKSAMLPIIADSISLERVSIYNPAVLRSNPLNGVILKNTTGKHLLQGPLTVLDDGGYAGDARIDNIPPGQERLLSYGIDLDMLVDNTKVRDSSTVVTAKIVKGMLVVSRKYMSSVEYAADNKSGKDKTLVIEHQMHPGWKLVSVQKPVESTASVYRFKGLAPANKVTTLLVSEEVVQRESLSMLLVDIGPLVSQSRTGEIPQNVRDAIGKAIQLKQSAIDVEQQISARTQRIADISTEQNRIRENMKTVAQSTQYYDRLLAKLNEQETSIESLQKERDALIARRDTLKKELEDYLYGLNVG